MRDIKVASIQMEHVDGDKPANLAKIEAFVLGAYRQDVEMIVFPECAITGYWFMRKLDRAQLVELAEPVPEGPSSQQLLKLALANRMTVGAGLVERDDDGTLYNTYVVAMPNGEVKWHRKIHCFISEHLASGDHYTVFSTPHDCTVGVLTCYDSNIFENTRMTALQGAEILLAPHQTGGCLSPSPHCMGLVDPKLWANRTSDPAAIEAEFRGPKGRQWLLTWLPSRAHDNGMFMIFSNGVGKDDDEIRTGNAMILDCYGRIVSETWKADDAMVVADLEADLRENCSGVRWIRSRRPELYKNLTVPQGFEKDTRTVRFQGIAEMR